jgi:hypothetical protein
MWSAKEGIDNKMQMQMQMQMQMCCREGVCMHRFESRGI